MSVSRIGVLTFHRCFNYGSYWQARCLVEGVRARGIHAVLLDHHSARVQHAELKCALQPLLPQRSTAADRRRYVAKTRKFFEAFEQLPLSQPFPLEAPEQTPDCDLILVGSDEVWNLRHPWYAGFRAFYGDGLRASRVASYAASFGNYPGDQKLEPEWAERLRRFSAISVRDENSRGLVRGAVGADPTMVLDPCLQFPPASSAADTGDYVAVYGHGFPDWFKHRVREAADRHGLRLISVGYRSDWADDSWIDAGPHEFASFIAGSRAVATNFFHGCVFSLLNDKPFVCALSDYRSNKVRDLTNLLGAERHLVREDTGAGHYDALLTEPTAAAVGERIGALRAQSTAYLDSVLGAG